MNWQQEYEDYCRIEKAIRYIEDHALQQPELADIAASIGLSEFHFQRLFTRWAGVSPKRFLQFLTLEHAKEMLEKSNNILDVTLRTGLSSPGRLHDLFITWEAVTPGEYKHHGEGLTITYGYAISPFGECLIARTDRGICNLFFTIDGNRNYLEDVLTHQWAKSLLQRDDANITALAGRLFSFYNQKDNHPTAVHLIATPFQLKVWEALLRIPPGWVVSYEDLAGMIQRPGSARAVSQAVAHNPISILIPCHRVIRKIGQIGGYRWGVPRKKVILGWEAARYGI
jgi:AraC family transcriptional regulator of adaptative response/methylated-DNA-[protein]-cysteine methyltransferase